MINESKTQSNLAYENELTKAIVQIKKEYRFYFTPQGELACEVRANQLKYVVKNNNAIKKLKELDQAKFNTATIEKKNLSLKNDTQTLVIENLKMFLEQDYLDYLVETRPKIKKAISLYQKEKHRKTIIRNIKKTAYKVAAGGLITALLYSEDPNIKRLAGFTDGAINSNTESLLDELDLPDTISAPLFNNDFKELESKEEMQSVSENLEQLFENESTNDLENKETAFLNFENNRYSEKGEFAYNNFIDLVTPYAKKWGISENIVMAMLTQESAGKDENLMQIQFWSWEDEELKAYNFEEKKYESFVLTKDPSKYIGKNITCITPEDLNNPKTNISMGCIILRVSAEKMHYHVGASIQCYNFGRGYMSQVLKETAKQTGVSVDDILNDQSNVDFMNYTYIINAGDPQYLNHVSSFLEENTEMSIKYLDQDGNEQENSVFMVSSAQQTMSK